MKSWQWDFSRVETVIRKVFDGTYYNPDDLSASFREFILGKDLPSVTDHSLRHTNATLQIAGSDDIRTVSRRLGHAQTSTTMNVYSHAIKSADESAASVLDDMLNQDKRKEKSSSQKVEEVPQMAQIQAINHKLHNRTKQPI